MVTIGIEVISNFPITLVNSGTVVGSDIGIFSSSLDGGDMSSFSLTDNAGGVIQGGIDGVKILADATHAATGTFIVDNAGTIESVATPTSAVPHAGRAFRSHFA